MQFEATHIPYQETSYFSKIVTDYLDRSDAIAPFYAFAPDKEGLVNAVQRRKRDHVDRLLLVNVLEAQYAMVQAKEAVLANIRLLRNENTFTVCTAHQPNLFTGPLYFIYKILHTIRLAAYLNEAVPDCRFVPVYYMGSEDADFAELNHTYVDGKRIEWKKEQTGAVGRMTVDNTLIQLINELEGQLYNEPFGPEMVSMLRNSYSKGKEIQTATFELVDALYGQYGLVVLIPDNALLKQQMQQVFLDDLFTHEPAQIVQKTSEQLEKHYKVQAFPRDINLFYLKDNIRERIIREGEAFLVHNTDIWFSESAIRDEVSKYPERFSPNVILRGLFQETILPNIAFIGGGGELAYWLQLKNLFEKYNTPYPVLVLRNSFLVIDQQWQQRIHKLELNPKDLFRSENDLMNLIVERYSGRAASLNGHLAAASRLYDELRSQAGNIDPTLTQHVNALKARSIRYLQELEKKMVRAEKRKYADQQRQIHKIREVLFPGNGLQERTENISGFYAKWGRAFIDQLYQNSQALESQFTILLAKP